MSVPAKRQTYERGIKSEKIAAMWLRLKGYKILEMRHKTLVGEIDIIARKKNTIVFVEVKARPTLAQAMESITLQMRQRIQMAAVHYMSKNYPKDYDMRFDVVAVMPAKLQDISRGRLFIHHLDNAWHAAA